MCPFEKVKLHKRLEHKFSSALRCCVRNIFNSSKGAFCCLFFKYLDTRNSYRSFQGGTLTTLSELGFHSLTCHCDQSLRMVFRWRTRDLLPAPPQTGSRHFFLSGCVLARLRILVNSLAPLIPQWLSTKPLGWSVTYTFNS